MEIGHFGKWDIIPFSPYSMHDQLITAKAKSEDILKQYFIFSPLRIYVNIVETRCVHTHILLAKSQWWGPQGSNFQLCLKCRVNIILPSEKKNKQYVLIAASHRISSSFWIEILTHTRVPCELFQGVLCYLCRLWRSWLWHHTSSNCDFMNGRLVISSLHSGIASIAFTAFRCMPSCMLKPYTFIA